jgi:hypothetical protein
MRFAHEGEGSWRMLKVALRNAALALEKEKPGVTTGLFLLIPS